MDSLDTDYLLRLARDKSMAGRRELAEMISDLFLGNTQSLSDRERALTYDILSQVIHDVEMAVRRNISEQLAKVPNAPRDLVLLLANDDIEVAYPILAYNKVLQDADLIEVIRHRVPGRRRPSNSAAKVNVVRWVTKNERSQCNRGL